MRVNLPAGALVPAIVATAATITLAAEFQKPITQWTCAEFLSIDDELKATAVHSAMDSAKSGEASGDRYQGHRESDPAGHR